MPAMVGQVRMPANNRVHSSATLQTHGIWQSAIRYDPYAPNQNSNNNNNKDHYHGGHVAGAEYKENNAYNSFQGLLALARLTSSNVVEAWGTYKKCGRVGHLTFQCHNFLSIKEDDVLQAIMERENNDNNNSRNTKFVSTDRARSLKNIVALVSGENFVEDEEESEFDVTVSDEDSEIERIIAVRFGNSHSKYKDIHKEKYRVSRVSQKSKYQSKMDNSESEDSEDDYSNLEERKLRRKRSRKRKKRSRNEFSNTSDSDDRISSDSDEKKRSRKRRRVQSSSDGDSDSKSNNEKRRRRKHAEKRH